jgi:hypothetical protein
MNGGSTPRRSKRVFLFFKAAIPAPGLAEYLV